MLMKILLNDATELRISWCGAADGILWVDGLSLTLAEALVIFSDPTKTAHIIAPGERVHDGYTTLIYLSLYDGLVKVALKKEV